MEIILALSIGALASSGVWLLLRSRTYQVLIGLSLLSYAVNLFIFSMGRVRVGTAHPQSGRTRRPGALHRSGPPGVGADGHRHHVRDDRPVSGGSAGGARTCAATTTSTGGGRPVSLAIEHLSSRPSCCRSRRRRCGAARRPPQAAEGRHCSHLDPGVAEHCHHAAHSRRRRRRPHERISPRELAGSVRHRAGGRPAVGPHADAHGHRDPVGPHLLHRTVAQGRIALPPAGAVPAGGPQRRVPHGRPLQLVRVLRDSAGGLLRTCPARLGRASRKGGSPLHRRQPCRLVAVPDRRQPDLRRRPAR